MSLDIIRSKNAWFVRGVLILLAVIMVLGLGFMSDDFAGMMGTPVNVAAEVNGEEISAADFAIMRDMIKAQLSPDADLTPDQMLQLNAIALNQLINTKLLAQKAKELGLRVTDEELVESITSNPAFQIDGQFVGGEMFANFIRQTRNQSVEDFEASYREEMLADKMSGIIQNTAVVTDENLLSSYTMENEKVNIAYIQLSAEDFASEENPAEDEIKSYYEKNKAKFVMPETRKIRYVELTPEAFESSIKITDEEIKSYYDAYSDEFQTEDGRVRPLEEVRGDIEARLKSGRADAARQRLSGEAGSASAKSVDAVAAEYSAGPVLEAGPFRQARVIDDVPPVIARRAFETESGQTFLIPVGNTVWAVEVTEVTPKREQTFEEAKEKAALELKEEKASSAASGKAASIVKDLNAAGRANLQAEAKKLGLEIEETGYFSRRDNVPGIGSAELRADAFQIDPGLAVSNKVYTNGENFYIVSFKDKQGVSMDEFQQEKEEIRAHQLDRQRAEIMQSWLQDMRRRAEIIPNAQLFPVQG
ncbi:MAG: SurA N-terminal domain-containing protein [Candidatus Dadabacteria bacterium]|nr:SurA N-terminal domain-containing protein [Candidatus Dadabacteria bacterium]